MKPEKIEKFRYKMAAKLPKPIFDVAVAGRHLYKFLFYNETRKRFGNQNSDKTFYVIRLCPPATGFLANYNYVLGYMKYAFSKGWIPVVDMENYATLYQAEKPYNGTRNVWEYFFEQPYDPKTNKRYSLKEVYNSKNVILAKADDQNMYCVNTDPETIHWQHEMSELIPFNQCMQKHVDEVYEKIIPLNVNVMGVPTRGSEQKKRIIGHPIPLNVDELLPYIQSNLKKWGGQYIFVKAEEMATIDYLKKNLPNVLYSDGIRTDHKNGQNIIAAFSDEEKKILSLRDYLTDIYILSRCESIMGTHNNGIATAIIWNGGKYSHVDVIDNGIWK